MSLSVVYTDDSWPEWTRNARLCLNPGRRWRGTIGGCRQFELAGVARTMPCAKPLNSLRGRGGTPAPNDFHRCVRIQTAGTPNAVNPQGNAIVAEVHGSICIKNAAACASRAFPRQTDRLQKIPAFIVTAGHQPLIHTSAKPAPSGFHCSSS
jgi:hypothetical protein